MSLFGGGLFEGGLAIGVLFTVPVFGGGVLVFGSHGGAATVAEVPAERGVLPDGLAALVVPVALLVSGAVLAVVDGVVEEVEGVAPGVVELVEVPAVVLPVDGGQGATVFVI